MISNIQNIIFDFGNVLVDLDIPRTERLFQNLLDSKFNRIETSKKLNHLIELLEVDAISESDFRNKIRMMAKNDLSDSEIDDALNGMLLHFPSHRFQLLEDLKKRFKTYLLSNTNSIHLRWVKNHIFHLQHIDDFDTRYFHKVYYSHLIKLRKPGSEIFQFVLSDSSLVPEETLFIDDNADNIEMADKFGIRTILHSPENDIGEVMQKIGILNAIKNKE
jgi:putative hydrolase of the HAD superfamily